MIGDRYKIYGKGSKKNQPDKVPALKLFDLVNDPAEKNDLAAKHPEIIKQMTLDLEKWRASCRQSDSGQDYSVKYPRLPRDHWPKPIENCSRPAIR